MKTKSFTIFRRIIILVFLLITGLGLSFTAITYYATTHFYQASTQLLNKDVAAHIAKFTSPFERDGLNKQKADSVFNDAMIISPSAEVYFLDTAGKVIAFHAPVQDIKRWHIPLENIKKYLASGGTEYITAADPKDSLDPKIFSAAEVSDRGHKLGYIYVILGSGEYRNVSKMLYGSHITNLVIEAFCFIMLISLLISFLYVKRIERKFENMMQILEKFQEGDLHARFIVHKNDDLAPVTMAFNKMADMLVYNINNLKKAEAERKDFITNISHDLRTPLAIVKGYTETLLLKKEGKEITTQQKQEFIQLITDKIQQIENLVEQLFELSKIEAVNFKPHREPFNFSEMLQELIKDILLQAEKKNIDIEYSFINNASWINADISMMERVVQNLLINAVSYTPDNGKIQIRLIQQQNELVLSIQNQGTPLHAAVLQWINTSGDEASITTRPETLTIGLTIVKKILSLHQYRFIVSADEQTGNLFSFYMQVYNPHS